MTPRTYLDNVVMPLHASFVEDSTSLAFLYATITTTYHIVDYIGKKCNVKEDIVRRSIIAECPEFHLVYSLALAQKHVVVTSKAAHTGLSTSDIKKPGRVLLRTQRGILTRNGRAVTMMRGFRTTIDGRSIQLENLIRKVLVYLDKNIESLEGRFEHHSA